MKFLPSLTGTLSGSIGGLTASRNRGGGYFRRKVVPVNTTSDQRTQIRGIFSTLANYWTNSLSNGQRAAWNSYANAVTITDVLGQSKKLTGPQWFIACNSPRLLAGDALITAAPTEFSIGPGIESYTPGALETDTQDLVAAVVNGAGIVSGDIVDIYISRPQNPSINYFKGPFRYENSVTAAGAGTVTVGTSGVPFPFSTGQKVFFRFVVRTADGRVGPEWITSQIATDAP